MKVSQFVSKRVLGIAMAVAVSLPTLAWAGDAAGPTPGDALFTANNVWMMICTALVFWMNLGFATLETGLTRAKNATNILFKNTIIPCIGLLTYGFVGFNLMYPGEFNGIFGFAGFGLPLPENGLTADYASGGYTYWTDFLFQGMFAATCATIVSGAVAERVKLSSFLVFTTVFVAVVYPVLGSWKWGKGWLDAMGFYDFAGSTLVHSVGGWAALAGALILGPRIGKYVNGEMRPIVGHSMPLATIGVFILWLGWFGFNGGSVLSADPGLVSLTLMTTSIAAAAGGLTATLVSWTTAGKPDHSMALNGILAGLVGITAGADQMGFTSAFAIGAIAGILVVFSVMLFDKIKIDDPVGAISVHLVNGVWGTLAVGIFGAKAGLSQLGVQALGAVSYGAAALVSATAIFYALKVTMGLRVSAEEELEGLDAGEHGQTAYSDLHDTPRTVVSAPVHSV